MKQFVYKSCGCSFDIIKEQKIPNIYFNLDISKINLDCRRTWQILSDGNTKGCFQLESRLGQSLAKRLKPSNIEELAALVSIMRPGCLEAFREGKSVTNHYIDKKNGKEAVDYFHPALKDILNKTYGEMIYQEQAMQIAQKIAGFDLQQADMLRKAIGKKKPEEMAKLKEKFISGAKKLNIVSNSEATELFNWIEKSQRYSFNKSHAVSYAFNAFLSAYAKSHFPKVFFLSYLMFAKDKINPQREIRELVNNAKEMGISVMLPDLRLMNENFLLHEQKICFGLTNIKGFGLSVYKKLKKIIDDNNFDIPNIKFPELYIKILRHMNSSAVKNMITAGGLDYMKYSRNYMIACLNCLSVFTSKEYSNILNNECLIGLESTEDLLSKVLESPTGRGQMLSSSKRHKAISDALKILQNPPYTLIDSPEWIADNEYAILGVALTCSKIDGCDHLGANITCSEFKNTLLKTISIASEIIDVKITKTKKGKNPGSEMAFVTISDSTGSVDSVILFPEAFSEFKDLIEPGNTVVISGNKNKEGDSLIVKKIWQV